MNDIILERLQKLEDELKRERDINRALQIQLSQNSISTPKIDFESYHRNKMIENTRLNLVIFQKLIDEIEQNEKIDKKLYNLQSIISQSEHKFELINYLDYLISLFPEHELLLRKILTCNICNESKIKYVTQWTYHSQYEPGVSVVDTIDVEPLLKTSYSFHSIVKIDENDLLVKLHEHRKYINLKIREITSTKYEELKKLQTEKHMKQFKECYEAKKPKIKKFFNKYKHKINQYKVQNYFRCMSKNYDLNEKINKIINNYFILNNDCIENRQFRRDYSTPEFGMYVVKHCIEEGNSIYKVYTTEDKQYIDYSFFSKNCDLFKSIEKFNETIKRFEDNLCLYGILYKVKSEYQGYILYNTEYYIIAQEENGKIKYKDNNVICNESEITFNPETYEIIEDEIIEDKKCEDEKC